MLLRILSLWFGDLMTIFSHLCCRLYFHPRRIKSGIFLLFWIVFAEPSSHASGFKVLKGNGMEVLFPTSLRNAAEETARMIPKIKKELQEIFKWPFDFHVTVILMKDQKRFHSMTRSPFVVGFAVPKKNLVVIDFASIRNPMAFEDILKHELCHLLLHKNIDNVHIPRWFDEGVAQWAANGMMDIVREQKEALLPKVVFSDGLIPLGSLEREFPQKENTLRLAYEESKSVIDYIISSHGKVGILKILELMRNGVDLPNAVSIALDTPLYKIEKKWRASLKQTITWFVQLSYYLYEILFAFGALILVYGFIKIFRKKRAYMEQD